MSSADRTDTDNCCTEEDIYIIFLQMLKQLLSMQRLHGVDLLTSGTRHPPARRFPRRCVSFKNAFVFSAIPMVVSCSVFPVLHTAVP